MHLVKESALCWKEQQQQNIGIPTFKLPAITKKDFMTDPLTIILNNFGTLLGNRIKVSCSNEPN